MQTLEMNAVNGFFLMQCSALHVHTIDERLSWTCPFKFSKNKLL